MPLKILVLLRLEGYHPHSLLERKQFKAVCKKAVLANMPSFRFGFLGSRNIKIMAFFCQGSTVETEFQYRGSSAKTTLLENTLLRTPDLQPQFEMPEIWAPSRGRN